MDLSKVENDLGQTEWTIHVTGESSTSNPFQVPSKLLYGCIYGFYFRAQNVIGVRREMRTMMKIRACLGGLLGALAPP